MMSVTEGSRGGHHDVSLRMTSSHFPSSSYDGKDNPAGIRWRSAPCRRSYQLITALIFLSTFVAYWERLGFSIAFTEIAATMGISETEKGTVFAAFFYGYSITPIPGGFLAKKYGGKIVLAATFLLWIPASALTALPASSIESVVPGVASCRVAVGLAQGMLLPAVHTVLAHWIPPQHRGHHFAFAVSGMYAGAAAAMVFASAFVAAYAPASLFYVTSASGVGWLLLWFVFGSSAPWDTSAPTPATSASVKSLTRSGGRKGRGGKRRKQVTLKVLRPKVPPPTALPVLLPSGSRNPGGKRVQGMTYSRDTSEYSERENGDVDSDLSSNTNIEDSTSTREGSWSAFGIPATDLGEFSVLNLAFYERCSRDKDQLRSASSSSCSPRRYSPMSHVAAANYCGGCGCPFTFPGSQLSVPGHGQRRGCLPTFPPVAEGGQSLVTYSGCGGGGRADGGGDAGNRLSWGASTATITPVSSWGSPTNGLRASGRFNSVQQSAGNRTWNLPPTPHRCAPVVDRGGAAVSDKSVNTSNSGESSMKLEDRGNYVDGTAQVTNSVDGGGYSYCTGAGEKRSERDVHVQRGRGETENGVSVDHRGGGYGGANAANATAPCALKKGENTLQPRISAAGCATAEAGGCFADHIDVGDNHAVRSAGKQGQRSVSSSSSKPPSFPWRAMSSSRPAWAVVIGNVGCSTGISVLMSWQPTYFESFLGVDLADLDLVYQLSPYLTMLVFSVLGGVWYSWLISTCDFSKSSASKIVTGVGLFGALVAFLSMTTTTTAAGGTCVTSGVLASLALSRGGWSTNHAEICAPEHGPMLFSVANCVSSITSVVGITITGAMLDNFGGADDVDAWKVAMGVIGGLCGVSGLFYAVFAAGNEVLFPAIGGSYGCDVSGADNENLDVGSSGDGQKARGEKRTLRQDEVIASRTVDGSRPILSNAGHENLEPV